MTEFVGRVTERHWIADALGRAAGGEAQLVLCVGEPGLGKTRFAQEAAGLAETMSLRVCWGRGTPDSGAPPYWPWREASRQASLGSHGGDGRGCPALVGRRS